MDNAEKPVYPNISEIYKDPRNDSLYPTYGNEGLTKRERFAMAAMQGLVNDYGYHKWEDMAHDAVKAADALLKELED